MHDSKYDKRKQLRRRGGAAKKTRPMLNKILRIPFFKICVISVFSVVCIMGITIRRKKIIDPETEIISQRDLSIHNSIYNRIEEMSEFPFFGSSILDVEHYHPLGGGRFSEWKDGNSPYIVSDRVIERSDALARERREHIKNAMKHAWNGYRTEAFGFDEVNPLSGGGNLRWNGLGTTLVDSLDTLWLMDMKDEFYEARDWLKDSLAKGLHEVEENISTFETTIRSLGGYLAAYDWSGDKIFLDAAKDLGDRLLKAFDSPSGIPWGEINLATGMGQNESWNPHENNIASIGTLQVEFRWLAKVTGEEKYAEKPMKAFHMLEKLKMPDGLYSSAVRNDVDEPHVGSRSGFRTFGGLSDSFYEYMLKLWLQGGKKEAVYRKMYDESIDGLHKSLLKYSEPNGLAYLTKEAVSPPIPSRRTKKGQTLKGQKGRVREVPEMEHLACFAGGMLALGAFTDPKGVDSDRAKRDLKTSKALAYTCYQMYAATKTGLSPESVNGLNKKETIKRQVLRKKRGAKQNKKNDQKLADVIDKKDFFPKNNGRFFLLRPETIETFYYLNKLTGDPIYREWGWEIFKSIEKYCKTPIAYGQYSDVTNEKAGPKDSMESFFLGETLKYLYLLFDPDSPVNFMEKHVFNTEAHPIRMFDAL
uniref:alpha-1,2-Mannosidase n=1 Tax=Chaetoceros debilis TaxID=122233 RepID=A0A7S3Q0Z8_9STRA|eukprot:CAMPEP_0194094428 /NCGR_PEP_ID=MMETSP0149-20130528/54014_1 /TAXON_ID=122233 /ORGANISM="Chaetoceros debilis, Strain MM31A-1" /LENGTH=644 /DNA_ID=CAMNT_0038780077 /DNA_START=142 /DNA_END=2076 /DNA_ORIENTATION=-